IERDGEMDQQGGSDGCRVLGAATATDGAICAGDERVAPGPATHLPRNRTRPDTYSCGETASRRKLGTCLLEFIPCSRSTGLWYVSDPRAALVGRSID